MASTSIARLRRIIIRVRRLTAAGGLAVTLSVAAIPVAARAQGATTADLDALIKAAKAEGGLTYYLAATENVGKRVGDAFMAKYGIKTQFIRLGSGPLLQRYSGEAQSGKFGADILFNAGNSAAFIPDGIKAGWLEPIEQAGIPSLTSGEFPRQFLRYGGAVIQVAPWTVNYNTDRIKGADLPKSWQEVIAPRFKGRILLADPKSSDAYLGQWSLLANTYGPSFLTAIRDQKPRWFVDGVPAIQALGAGEGDLEFPIIAAATQGIMDKGGPINWTIVEPTTGVEMFVMLTARSHSEHPNAARLLAQFVMSPEGNNVWNGEKGSFSVYDTAHLPKGYSPPDPAAVNRKQELRKLLGLD